jgi:tRNA(Ile)-lysidine synthase
VLHYDHAARPDSAADAAFVAELAAALDVACVLGRRPVAAGAPAPTEAALRTARWAFFREQLKLQYGRLIFFGHQRDDIVETVLMRLARGSGAGGLSAPRPVQTFADDVVALRPLLNLGREELRAALRAAGVAWRDDPTNDTDICLRNRLRRHVIPAWSEAVGERNLAAGVARSRALLEEDDEALEAIGDALLAEYQPGKPMRLAHLAGQSRALWRRALRRWLEAQSLGETFSASSFDELHGAIMLGAGGRWSAGQGCWVEVKDGALMLSRYPPKAHAHSKWPILLLQPSHPAILPHGGSLVSSLVDHAQRVVDAIKTSSLDGWRHACLALPDTGATPALLVRSWRPGDRYRPLGAPGTRKLQDLFTDRKIPAMERNRLPLVCNADGTPLWVPGLPPAESCRVSPETRRALWLTYYPPGERM